MNANPYAPHEHTVASMTDLFGSYRLAEKWKPGGKRATSERAELIGYFSSKMGWTDRAMAVRLSYLEMRDLYHLKSDCDAAEREGRCAWQAAFRTALGLTKRKQAVASPL